MGDHSFLFSPSFPFPLSKLNGNYLSNSKSVYVSPSGNDSTGDGTENNPWKTITHAIDQCPYGNVPSYTIRIAAGTYKENIIIRGKYIAFVIYGNVTIIGSDNTTPVITVDRFSRLAISANEKDTYILAISNGTNGIYISDHSSMSFDSSIKKVSFGTVSSYCINVAGESFCNLNASFQIVNTVTATTIFRVSTGGVAVMTSSSESTITGTVEFTRAFQALTMGRIYVYNVTIPSGCSIGLRAESGGQISYNAVTNNATTPISTGTGGRVYTGAQS